jgi:hypothetical protein
MSTSASQRRSEDRTSDATPRWLPPQRVLRFVRRVLIGLVFVCVVFGAFEFIVWHMPVDSFSFTAYDANGKILAHIVRSDAQEANTLRQQINNKPQAPIEGTAIHAPTVALCMEPIYTGPIASYRYNFWWHDLLIETVWVDFTACGGGWVSSGGSTIGVLKMPVVPKGVHLPPGHP